MHPLFFLLFFVHDSINLNGLEWYGIPTCFFIASMSQLYIVPLVCGGSRAPTSIHSPPCPLGAWNIANELRHIPYDALPFPVCFLMSCSANLKCLYLCSHSLDCAIPTSSSIPPMLYSALLTSCCHSSSIWNKKCFSNRPLM